MIPAYRNNSRPQDGHIPADWDHPTIGTWSHKLWALAIAILIAGCAGVLVLALVAGGAL